MSAGSAPDSPRPAVVAIVPARLGSQRLPRKMLLDDTGWPLVVHTALNLRQSRDLARVIVAADHPETLAAAERFGVQAVMTRPDHQSGTDRVHEALRSIGGACDVLINVQGDEPELHLPDLARLIAAFGEAEVVAATLCAPLERPEQALEPSVVKVVRDARGDALYFSRAPIPHRSDDARRAYARDDARPWAESARRHIGVYAFRPEALERFVRLPRGQLERLENLEQLRWLEAGERMRVVEAERVPLGIDTRADYDAFVERMRRAPRTVAQGHLPRS